MVAGFATKSGLIPFHGWLPDAHTPVPGAVSALFSALMVDLGIVGLVRLSFLLFPETHRLAGLLTCLGCVSALAGALLTLVQDDFKRLLAWDTVSQMGVLLIGFASHTVEGVAGAVYHLVNHGVFKALLFLCAGAVVHGTGKTHLSQLGGLARSRWPLAAGFVVGALAISGVPPLNGYMSLGLLHKGIEDQPIVFAVALLAQTITVAALARATYLAFFRRRDEPYEQLERPRAGMVISLAALAAGCVTFGVFAETFIKEVASPAASALFHRAVYATGVLGGHAAFPRVEVSFEYVDVKDLLITAAEIVVGLGLAVLAVRRPVPRPVQWLRAVHTGSVNDYAAYLVAGLVVTGYVLLA
jgi:multicomponent Na+:H+ antiporter subunit D